MLLWVVLLQISYFDRCREEPKRCRRW